MATIVGFFLQDHHRGPKGQNNRKKTKIPDGRGREVLAWSGRQLGMAVEASNRKETTEALLLLLSYDFLKTHCLLPHLLQLRSTLQESSGVKSRAAQKPYIKELLFI